MHKVVALVQLFTVQHTIYIPKNGPSMFRVTNFHVLISAALYSTAIKRQDCKHGVAVPGLPCTVTHAGLFYCSPAGLTAALQLMSAC